MVILQLLISLAKVSDVGNSLLKLRSRLGLRKVRGSTRGEVETTGSNPKLLHTGLLARCHRERVHQLLVLSDTSSIRLCPGLTSPLVLIQDVLSQLHVVDQVALVVSSGDACLDQLMRHQVALVSQDGLGHP